MGSGNSKSSTNKKNKKPVKNKKMSDFKKRMGIMPKGGEVVKQVHTFTSDDLVKVMEGDYKGKKGVTVSQNGHSNEGEPMYIVRIEGIGKRGTEESKLKSNKKSSE